MPSLPDHDGRRRHALTPAPPRDGWPSVTGGPGGPRYDPGDAARPGTVCQRQAWPAHMVRHWPSLAHTGEEPGRYVELAGLARLCHGLLEVGLMRISE